MRFLNFSENAKFKENNSAVLKKKNSQNSGKIDQIKAMVDFEWGHNTTLQHGYPKYFLLQRKRTGFTICGPKITFYISKYTFSSISITSFVS